MIHSRLPTTFAPDVTAPEGVATEEYWFPADALPLVARVPEDAVVVLLTGGQAR